MPVTQKYTRMTQISIVMVASPDMNRLKLFWSHLFDFYNDNVSQWTLPCLVSYTFPLLYIGIYLNTSHPLLHSSRQHAFTFHNPTILNCNNFHTIHWATCRPYQATSEQCESGVFYETQLGETSCEMRHYIIGLTRSHDYHHLRHHHHYKTPCRHHQNSFLYSSYMISTRYY